MSSITNRYTPVLRHVEQKLCDSDDIMLAT